MGFGLEIKRLREEAGISAQKLADAIGIDAERLRKWEQKDLTPRFEDVQIIEKFFGMSLPKIEELESIKKFLIVPHETLTTTKNSTERNIDILIETNRMLTEANLKHANNYEVLIAMLRDKENKEVGQITLDQPGTPGTETLNPRKQKSRLNNRLTNS